MMLPTCSCFGTAASYHGVSSPVATSAQRRWHEQQEAPHTTDAGAGGSGTLRFDAAASTSARDGRASTSIWLHPPYPVGRGGAGGIDSAELPSSRQAGAARATTSGRHVQQKSPGIHASGRRTISRRYNNPSRRTTGPTRGDGSSPRVAFGADGVVARRMGGSHSNTSETARDRRRLRLDQRQVLAFPGRRRAAARSTTSGSEAADALQQRERDRSSESSAESGHFTEDYEETRGSAAGRSNAVTRDVGRSRRLRYAGLAGLQAPATPARPRTEEGPARGRRVLWGGFRFPEDAEDQGSSSNYLAEEDAAEEHGSRDAPDDVVDAVNYPSHRRRRRSNTGWSSTVQETMPPPFTVKPCIWIAPLFAVDGGAAAGIGAADAGVSGPEAPTVETAGAEASGLWLTSYAGHAGAVRSFPEATARNLASSESAAKGAVTGVEGSSASAADTRGGMWSSGTRTATLVRKASRQPHGHNKRGSAVRFFAKRIFWVFWYFVAANLFMCALSTASDLVYQYKPQPKLHDRFHDWFFGGTPPPGLVQAVTDCLTVSLLAITMLRHLLFVQLPLNLLIICRYFFLMATTYWLRGIAIFVTTMPSSVPNCKVRPVNSPRDFIENVLLASVFQLPQCTDMVISGHTLCTGLCVATWLFYNNCNKDEAEMQQAPFHIFMRWLRRHRRQSATPQQEEECDSRSASAEPTSRRHQLQQRQQLPEQRSRKGGNFGGHFCSGSTKRTEGSSAAKCDSLVENGKQENHSAALLPTASAVGQHNCGPATCRSSEISNSCRVDVDTACIYGQRVADEVCHKEELKFLSVADSQDEPRCEIADEENEEGTAGEGGTRENVNAAERRAPTAVASLAVLRNKAVVGAAAAVSETCVAAAAAVASELFLSTVVPAGRSLPATHVEGSSVSVDGTVPSFVDGTACAAAGAACGVPFAACDGEGASPSAASAALCAAFAAVAVVEEDERNSVTHVQEMKNLSCAALDRRAAGAAEQLVLSADDQDRRVLKTPMNTTTVRGQGAREIICTVEDCLLLSDKGDGGTEAPESSRVDSEFPTAYYLFNIPAALGQEQPFSPGHTAPLTADEKSGFLEAPAAGGQGKKTDDVASAFSSACGSVRAAATAVSSDEKLPHEGRATSQCTAGAGSCSSSEDDDGMRALLDHHQSRRHQTEKINTLQFSCCTLPPGLSSFFTAAHTSCAPGPATQEEAPASTLVPSDEKAVAGQKGGTEGHGAIVRNRYYGISSREGEELERMGQYDTEEGPAARGRGKGGTHGVAAGVRAKGGLLQWCNVCLSSIGRRLVALVCWASMWNLLGTWCILQAAANIIIIDASFCHYTVDIFFGVIFSFGCFTFYHMIVCLLWAARTQNAGGAADAGEGYYAVVRVPSSRGYRRRTSYSRNLNSSNDSTGTPHTCGHAAGAARELPWWYSPCRRRAARAAARSRAGMMKGAGGGAAAREPCRGMLQETAGKQNSSVERRSGGRGRKAREAAEGGDLNARESDMDSGLPEVESTIPRVGGSPAVALSVMREMEGDVCHTGSESRRLRLPAGGGGTAHSSPAGTPVQGMSQFATADTAVIAVSTPSFNGDPELAVANALAEDETTQQGWCGEENGLHLLARTEQRERGETAHLACAQQQDVEEVPAGEDRHLQSTAQHLRERPAETLVANLDELRVPRLPEWDCEEGAPEDAKPLQRSTSDASELAGKRSRPSCTGGAALAGAGTSGEYSPAVATQSRGLREPHKKARSSKDVAAKGLRTRGHSVLQSVERVITGGSRDDVVADIAISILRFPLIRCAAFFVARLEGLELP